MIEQKQKLGKDERLERKATEKQLQAKRAKDVFSGDGAIMIWLVADGGSKHANIPDNVRMGMPKNDSNRTKKKIADLVAKFPDLAEDARKRILEKRRQVVNAAPERELVPA